ncbi:hypothetical protein BS47DRAFT_1485297 [Hydnum rufescens UP504]|uniref:SET domain-containing protein n=1 Tax=Hydnum rufescens UP504 TaxID=1448309 RepID=A0A9P6AYB9_9AGAM|nr:hypothetical protein BS47DRAFT_1485297 [Hydnum rufescens UP504]
MSEPKTDPAPYNPSHPDLFKVHFQEGDYSSSLRAARSFKAGENICHIGGYPVTSKTWRTVQSGIESHFELDSDLVYVNHSCEPNVIFDISSENKEDWNVRAARDISEGTPLEYFYPSTEWDMDRKFICNCKTKTCIGKVEGARYVTIKELEARGFINRHIIGLAYSQDAMDNTRDPLRIR